MAKEPYNIFRTAGSQMPGGSQYDDMMVVLKAIVKEYGNEQGELHIPEELLMYVDRDEALHIDDRFNTVSGFNEYVISLTGATRPTPGPERPIQVKDEGFDYEELGRKIGFGCGIFFAVVVAFTFLYLCFHVISWIVAGVTS